MRLDGKSVALLVENDYQDQEVWYPLYRLREEGARVEVVGTGTAREYKSKFGYPIGVNLDAKDAVSRVWDGVVIPGGWAPDRLRQHAAVLDLVRATFGRGKVVAAICHAGWVLASAGVCKGKRVTSFAAIKDDLTNAGATWVDQEVVRDGNLITSRKPDDLPAFLRTIIAALAET